MCIALVAPTAASLFFIDQRLSPYYVERILESSSEDHRSLLERVREAASAYPISLIMPWRRLFYGVMESDSHCGSICAAVSSSRQKRARCISQNSAGNDYEEIIETLFVMDLPFSTH